MNTSRQQHAKPATQGPGAQKIAMKFEVAAIPVADVDRSKRFYSNLGWRLDADFVVGDNFRVVQFTPPGSPASIYFGKGMTWAAPGAAQGLFLVVSDIEAARAELVAHGANVGEVFHVAGPGQPPLPGRDPERRSYFSYAMFKDPDGTAGCCRRSPHGSPVVNQPNEVRFGSRLGERLPARGSRAWRAREADRRSGFKLAGLVREVHCGGAGRQRATALRSAQLRDPI